MSILKKIRVSLASIFYRLLDALEHVLGLLVFVLKTTQYDGLEHVLNWKLVQIQNLTFTEFRN